MLVTYAKTIKPGTIELVVDSNPRYFAKMNWFDNMLDNWQRRGVKRKLDGSSWEGGWNQRAKLAWALI